MSSDNSSGGAGQDGGGAAADQNKDANAGGDSGKKDPVSWDDHQRALRDVHKFKDKAKALEGDYANLKAEVEALKAGKLKESNDFKTLYEAEAEKSKAQNVENQRLKLTVKNNERYRALMPALKEAGMLDSAHNILERLNQDEWDKLDVEVTSHGRMLVNGVADFVKDFKEHYPYVFKQRGMPNVNGAGGQAKPGESTDWTPAKIDALERECRRKGDMAPYRAAVEAYRKNKK